MPFYTERADLQRATSRLFDHPSEAVFGEESADTACERFTAALRSVMAANPQPCVAVVTHGTVRSLYVAQANGGLSAHTLWQQQMLLDVLSVSWPDGKLQQQVFQPEQQKQKARKSFTTPAGLPFCLA